MADGRRRGAALMIGSVLAIVPIAAGQWGRWDRAFDLLNALLFPAIVALAIVLAIALVLRRKWAAGVAAVGLVAGAVQLAWGVAPPAFGTDNRTVIRVASINAHHSNFDPDLLARQLAQTDADIVLVQEANGTAAEQIAQALPSYYHTHNCPYDYCSMTVISRWPAQHIALPKPEGPQSALLATRVQTPGGQVQLINVHLPRPAQEFALQSRAAVLAAIEQLGAQRLIVAGDFNLPSGSFALGEFTEQGGLSRHDFYWPTYPAYGRFGAVLDIDHIFASGDIAAHGCERLALNGSDHRGMLCEVSIEVED